MELRRVQRTTDGTFFITLPKRWMQKVRLDKGSLVRVNEHENSMLTINPYSESEREVEAIVLEPSPMIDRLIGENYLLGADVIEVRSSKVISTELRNKVKAIIKKFVGLEIVEEDSKKIVIQCLLEPSTVIPEKILRRIHLISLEMEKDALDSLITLNIELAKNVIERDEEVDRLYFLIVRLVRAALTYPSLGEKLSITPIECLDNRLLASLIEHFADYATSIGTVATSPMDKALQKDIQIIFSKVSESVYTTYKDAFTAYIKRDLSLAEHVTECCHVIKVDIAKIEEQLLFLEKEARERLTSVMIALNSMCEVCIDIADLA